MATFQSDDDFKDELNQEPKVKSKVKKQVQYKAPPSNKSYAEKAQEELKRETKLDDATRNMKGIRKVHHDLFKLLPADFQKNFGLPKAPRWVPTPHCHYFHTRDSSGKLQEYTCAVGGHVHKIDVTIENGLLVAKCGPPVIRVKGDRVVDFPNDDHTHEVEYLWSEEIEARKMNKAASKAIAQYQQLMQGNLDAQ